jgi:hypothetical protein
MLIRASALKGRGMVAWGRARDGGPSRRPRARARQNHQRPGRGAGSLSRRDSRALNYRGANRFGAPEPGASRGTAVPRFAPGYRPLPLPGQSRRDSFGAFLGHTAGLEHPLLAACQLHNN